MALAGDIIIKLAADFAEFSQGMLESTKQLEEFGKKSVETGNAIQSAIGWMKGLAAATGVLFVVGKVQEFTDKIDQQALAVAKLAQQYKLSAIEVQALQGVAEKTGRAFGELVETAGKNPKWLDDIVLGARASGTALDDYTIASIKEMDERAVEAQKKIVAMFAPFYASTKMTALENAQSLLATIVADLQRAKDLGIGTLFQPGVFDPQTGQARSATGTEIFENELAKSREMIAEAKRNIEVAKALGDDIPAHIEVRNKALQDALQRETVLLNQRANAAAKAASGIVGSSETAVPIPPVTVTADKTGGGGRTDAETIDALILRYQKMAKAADEAKAAVRANVGTDINDLGLIVEAKQAAQDAVAKIERTVAVSPAQQKALEQAILNAKLAQAEQNRALDYAKQADALEKSLGDGTRAQAAAVETLNRERASGRLSDEAYTRALKQQTEQINQAALAARRYDDDLGSLAAGFEAAAQQYARANDLFSQGGSLFTGITSTMGEGLDVLVGKSTKTFNQIASDFATMLAKMALQAALSPVFKLISGSLGNLFGGGGGVTPPVLSDSGGFGPTATARAGGGDVYGGQPYWVGEYGPERFVPQGAGRIEPSGGGDVFVSIANYTDASVSAKKNKGPGGQTQVDVIVEMVEGKMASRLSRGQGSLGRTMEGRYGLQQVGR